MSDVHLFSGDNSCVRTPPRLSHRLRANLCERSIPGAACGDHWPRVHHVLAKPDPGPFEIDLFGRFATFCSGFLAAVLGREVGLLTFVLGRGIFGVIFQWVLLGLGTKTWLGLETDVGRKRRGCPVSWGTSLLTG